MIRTRWAFALVLAFAGAACGPQDAQRTPLAGVDTAAVRAAIDTLRASYERAFAASDFERLGTMLAESAVMVGPGGPAHDSLRAASPAPWPPGATIEISPIEVRVLSDEWAYEFGTSVITYRPEGAAQARSLSDTYLVLFRNTGDGWRLYREVASSNLPPGRGGAP